MTEIMNMVKTAFHHSFSYHLELSSPYLGRARNLVHKIEHKKMKGVSVQVGKQGKNGEIQAVDSAALYLQFGRYLFICSSVNAQLPPNLQGIWADAINTAWHGDYHLNINVQMNHWPMEPGNLSDLSEPITRYVESIVQSGERTAQTFYGTDGWAGHVLANAWHFTAPSEDPRWGSSFTGGAWIALQLWEHYLFTKDEDYLRRIYPVIKGAAEFLRANLFEFDGYLVTGPSTSPENAFRKDGKRCCICAGPTMDTQICQEIFSAVEQASEILKTDSAFANILKSTAAKLPPMRISAANHQSRQASPTDWRKDGAAKYGTPSSPRKRQQSVVFPLAWPAVRVFASATGASEAFDQTMFNPG